LQEHIHAASISKIALRKKRPRSPFIPANPSRRSSVERSAACPTDRALFLLFVRVVLPESAHEPPTGGSPGGWHSVVARTSCCPHFHCAEWFCVVLTDSPRHRIGSGTNWPVKSRCGKWPN